MHFLEFSSGDLMDISCPIIPIILIYALMTLFSSCNHGQGPKTQRIYVQKILMASLSQMYARDSF